MPKLVNHGVITYVHGIAPSSPLFFY